ncbi:MAG: phospholipase A, partial [Proteobacteria bacterium]|nr:phospholipase A [Pseudomonadota bacterium]
MNRYWLLAGCLIACFTGVTGCPAPAGAAAGYEACAAIDDGALRLRCYDEAAGRRPKEPAAPSATAALPPAQTTPPAGSRPSVLSRMWQLDDESRRRRFAIMPYRQNYLLPYAYNFNQEKQTYEAANPGTEIQNAEAKYQLSLKMKLWEDILGTNMDLWGAYTQVSLWQVYNTGFSSPFRETNYEPEILLNYRTDTDLWGLKSRFIQVGLNHQSNGRGEPLSRSWNRFTANFGFERGDFNVILKTWARIPEEESKDDNPDITSYLGYGEIWAGTVWRNYHLALMFRNNLRFGENRSAL